MPPSRGAKEKAAEDPFDLDLLKLGKKELSKALTGLIDELKKIEQVRRRREARKTGRGIQAFSAYPNARGAKPQLLCMGPPAREASRARGAAFSHAAAEDPRGPRCRTFVCRPLPSLRLPIYICVFVGCAPFTVHRMTKTSAR